jgi:hypothetical protein
MGHQGIHSLELEGRNRMLVEDSHQTVVVVVVAEEGNDAKVEPHIRRKDYIQMEALYVEFEVHMTCPMGKLLEVA